MNLLGFKEFLQLPLLLLTVTAGFMLLIQLSAHRHRHSAILFFIVSIGFIHEVSCGIDWVKFSEKSDISLWTADVNTLPSISFALIVVLIVVSITMETNTVHNSRFILRMYCVYLLWSVPLVYTIHSYINSCKNKIDFLMGTSSESDNLNSCWYKTCGNIEQEQIFIFAEYILLHVPVTIIFLKNVKRSLSVGEY